MKYATLRTLLLVAYLFGPSAGSSIAVFHNSSDIAVLKVSYSKPWDPRQQQDATLKPGESKTIDIPYNGYNVEVWLSSSFPRYRTLYGIFSASPVGSLVTLGTADDPQARLIKVAYAESRSVTVFNNGTFYGSLIFGPPSNGKLFFSNRNFALEMGAIMTFTIPDYAGKVSGDLSYYTADPELINPSFDDNLNQTLLLNINALGHNCYKLTGTYLEPKHTKIDCKEVYLRDVTLL